MNPAPTRCAGGKGSKLILDQSGSSSNDALDCVI